MVESLVLKAERRTNTGTQVSRKLRAAGLVPAIIYGHKQDPVAVVLIYHDLALEVQHRHRLLDVELDGKAEKFLLKDVQYDHLGDRIIHVDLARVKVGERVQVAVTVELRGVPAGVAEGGVLDQLRAEVELECPVISIPEVIRVSVAHLNIGDTLTAGELEMPEGSKLVTESETPLVTVRVLAEEVEEEVSAEGEGVEPEVISEKPEEGSEESGEKDK